MGGKASYKQVPVKCPTFKNSTWTCRGVRAWRILWKDIHKNVKGGYDGMIARLMEQFIILVDSSTFS